MLKDLDPIIWGWIHSIKQLSSSLSPAAGTLFLRSAKTRVWGAAEVFFLLCEASSGCLAQGQAGEGQHRIIALNLPGLSGKHFLTVSRRKWVKGKLFKSEDTTPLSIPLPQPLKNTLMKRKSEFRRSCVVLVLLYYTWSFLIMIKLTFVGAAGNRLYFCEVEPGYH